MAERERFRFDLRAVRIGVVNGAFAGAVAVAFAYGISLAVTPVVRDLAGNGYSPGPVAFGLVGAGVGLVFGFGKMRSARRVVVAGYTGTGRPGSRALELARVAAARPDPRGVAGAEVARSVRRWSPDLLLGGDLLEVEEVIVYGPESGSDRATHDARDVGGVGPGTGDGVPAPRSS